MASNTKKSWLGMLKTFKIIGFHHIWSKKNSIPHMCNFPLSDVLKRKFVAIAMFLIHYTI